MTQVQMHSVKCTVHDVIYMCANQADSGYSINPPVLDDYFRLKIIQQLFPQSLCLQVHNLLHGEPAENEEVERSHISHVLIMWHKLLKNVFRVKIYTSIPYYNHLYAKQRTPDITHLY